MTSQPEVGNIDLYIRQDGVPDPIILCLPIVGGHTAQFSFTPEKAMEIGQALIDAASLCLKAARQ